MNKPADDCGFATALKVIGGKWKVDILCALEGAPRRFGRLRQSIPAISEKMLAQQLRELEADGIVDRKAYPGAQAKVVYSLTARGAALNVGAAALCRWGEEHLPHGDKSSQSAAVGTYASKEAMPSEA